MLYSGIYSHRNCLDVVFDIKKIIYRHFDYFKVKVVYINRKNGIIYNYQPETVKIYKKDLWKWSPVLNMFANNT